MSHTVITVYVNVVMVTHSGVAKPGPTRAVAQASPHLARASKLIAKNHVITLISHICTYMTLAQSSYLNSRHTNTDGTMLLSETHNNMFDMQTFVYKCIK